MSVCLLVFASSRASDYLPITLDRLKQFFPKVKSYLGIDSRETGNTMNKYYNFDEIIIYSMNDTWSKKVHDILLRIKEDYIFFLIDNNIFVDIFTIDQLNYYINFMKDKQIDQLRMLPSEVSSGSIIRNNEGIYRNFEIVPYDRNTEDVKPLYSNVSINLINGLIIEMCGNIQTEFRHGIRQNNELKRRISISFRAFE